MVRKEAGREGGKNRKEGGKETLMALHPFIHTHSHPHTHIHSHIYLKQVVNSMLTREKWQSRHWKLPAEYFSSCTFSKTSHLIWKQVYKIIFSRVD